MNRRGFFRALGAIAVAVAPLPFVRSIEPSVSETNFASIGSAYAKHLAQSMVETKETLTANVLNCYSHRTYALGFALTSEVVGNG